MAKKAAFLTSALLGLANAAQQCKARNLPAFDLPGIKIVNLKSEERRDYEWKSALETVAVPVMIPIKNDAPISFCSITVTYTHIGQNDTINTVVWLPIDGKWNGNYLGLGGGGWAAGGLDSLGGGVALGYATANTDAGHSYVPDERHDFVLNAESWGYLSKENVHWVNLQNFASIALDDLPKIAKHVIGGFYDKAPKYSYFSGCSTGGRQGLVSAQRFPENYNGILSVAPAINWATFLVTELWPHVLMHRENYWPEPAEFAAITEAAFESCDALDGVKDGVISDAEVCKFDAKDAVGLSYSSNNEIRKVSAKAAKIANAIWEGPKKDGEKMWYGNTHETKFGGPMPFDGLASTACDSNNKNCKSAYFPIAENWNKLFVQKDKDFDVTTMTENDLWKALAKSRREYTSIIDTADPDLSEFKAAGGKIVNWHGLADQIIPPGGMTDYYKRVKALDPDVESFYRFFEAPGIEHCSGGPGAFPADALSSLVDWVENGRAPKTLDAATIPSSSSDVVSTRILCPWPKVAAYKGGDSTKASSFECADTIDQFSSKWGAEGSHGEL
ncbi:tannase precursor [Acrodontium crateriforme]|uniref:Carboxylic ester hydrolase n=1 Tax=Acrodontium crateriforme TaxID=150365 RepID=A0AAQ3R9H8_9PEZI|nr:tannase precursor [Acrodontium crateriforme]